MDKKQMTNRIAEFRTKMREAANQVLNDFELDRRILKKSWVQPRRTPQFWSDITQGS